MSDRLPFLVILVWAASLWGACGPEAEPGAEGEASFVPAPISGMYEVSGVTVVTQTGDKREISGKIILAEDGDAYIATYSLTTLYPMGAENLPAEVIGKGEGVIDGRRLEGTAATQLVIAMVPGVDPAFAFVPRHKKCEPKYDHLCPQNAWAHCSLGGGVSKNAACAFVRGAPAFLLRVGEGTCVQPRN